MATNFPIQKDEFSNPIGTDSLQGHAEQHQNVNDAVEAIERVVGVTDSTDPNSLTYKINDIVSVLSGLGNSTDTISTLLGLDGNNDLIVTGIENKTVVDSFASSEWRSADYKIVVSKVNSNLYEAFSMKAIHDNSDIYVTTSDIVSNSNVSLANVTFEENSGIISLCVTPVSGSVTVRYIRTALKN